MLDREAAPQQRRWRGRPRRGGAEEAVEEAARERGGGREAAGGGGGRRARGGEAHGDGGSPCRKEIRYMRAVGEQRSAAVAAWRSLVSTGGGRTTGHGHRPF